MSKNKQWVVLSEIISQMQLQILKDNIEMQKRQLKILILITILSIISILSIIFLLIK